MSIDICRQYTDNFKEQEAGVWTEGVVGIKFETKDLGEAKKVLGM